MLFIPEPIQQVNHLFPLAVSPYFDKVAVWLKQPIDRATIAKLRKQCGGLHVGNYRARFDRSYRQRLEFKQPKYAALIWIAWQTSGLINSVEVASDMTFANRRQVEEAQEFLNYHLCRRWHGNQHVHIHYDTRYDASPWARNKIVLYPQRHSRITGECDVLHLEWRAIGVDAVRRAGISSGQDLLNFDHRKFWEKRLLLLDTTPERIGLYLRNRRQGTRSRMPNRLDERQGTVVLDSVFSMQELIDECGRCFDIRRVMTELPSEPFLPPPLYTVVNQRERP
jgi:hypothetical protein